MDKRFKLGDEAQTLVECGGEIGVEYEVKWSVPIHPCLPNTACED